MLLKTEQPELGTLLRRRCGLYEPWSKLQLASLYWFTECFFLAHVQCQPILCMVRKVV